MQSAVSESPQQTTAAPPDWNAITQEVACPLCGYNLRGLLDPRCPECGYPFDWATVLHPEKYRHPYLFEQHPSRPHVSFFRTLGHHLRPIKFWKTLEASHPVRPARILLYWSGCCLLLVLFGGLGLWNILGYPTSWRWFVRSLFKFLDLPQAGVCGTLLAVMALFPWLSFVTLLIFQQSMRRSKIKAVHVLRCAIYCGDVVVWCAVAFAMIVLNANPDQNLENLRHPLTSFVLAGNSLVAMVGWSLLAMMLVNGWRLWAAYRFYLRMPGALAAAVASQMIVLLVIFGLFAYMPVFW